MKFQRNYLLTVQLSADSNDVALIKPPITLNFETRHANLASTHDGTFVIYNLSESLRHQIYFDWFNFSEFKYIELKAGYGDDIPLIFAGNIRKAYSVREGTNWKTTIEAFDGGYTQYNSFTTKTLPAQTSFREVFSTLSKDLLSLKGLTLGNISGTSYRGLSLSGNTWDLMNSFTSDNIQLSLIKQQAFVLNTDEYVQKNSTDQFIKLDSKSGLLNTPQRQQNLVKLSIVFEPHLEIYQLAEVESLETIVNGNYMVIGVSHRGIISEAVNGTCITEVNLQMIDEKAFKGVPYRNEQ